LPLAIVVAGTLASIVGEDHQRQLNLRWGLSRDMGAFLQLVIHQYPLERMVSMADDHSAGAAARLHL